MRLAATVCVVASVLFAWSTVAAGGLVDVAVGGYGGINVPFDPDGSPGSVIGAKLRILPAIPLVGAEVYWSRIGVGDRENAWGDGGVSIDFDGDGFSVFGADVLVDGVGGLPGFRWYGIAGVNFVDFAGDGGGFEMGGGLGVGVEFVPPVVGFSVEVRGTLMMLGWAQETSPKLGAVTVGMNYRF